MAAEPAMAVIGAFQRERELVRDVAMEIDLSADGRFVLTDGLGDSGPGRAVKDAGLDDLAFIESDVKMLIRRSHKRYLRSKRGIQIVETKCNFGPLSVAFTFSLQSFLNFGHKKTRLG